MKCLVCGAPTEVLETREFNLVFTRRRRKCFNNHIRYTYEVGEGMIKESDINNVVNGVHRRNMTEKRRKTIAKHQSLSNAELGRMLNISGQRVGQIRKELGNADPRS